MKKANYLLCAVLFFGIAHATSVAPDKGSPSPQPQSGDTYSIDRSHTYVIFRINHLNVGNSYGMFRDTSGGFFLDNVNPQNSSIELTVQADSVFTADQKRDEHLRGSDFLNTKQFPTATFKSKKVKKLSKNQYEVVGDLTLHGVTKSITTRVEKTGEGKDPWGNQRMGFETTFELNRQDYGITYMKGALGDTIKMTFSVEGIKK